MTNLTKISPTPGDLPRQDEHSYIMIDRDVEFELGHFKGMLTLGAMEGMDMNNPANAYAAMVALERATNFLSVAIGAWVWQGNDGEPIQESPQNNPLAFEGCSMTEINWMLEAVSATIKEEAATEGN